MPCLIFVFQKSSFIDSLRIHVRGGAGGQGHPKFGGIGGKGGNVVLKTDSKIFLRDVKEKHPTKRFAAGGGKNSR